MCLRYSLKQFALAAFQEALAEAAAAAGVAWSPRYNVALTSRMPVIVQRDRPALETMRFGLQLPTRSAAKKPLLMGNARAETLQDKPGFREAAFHRRCLVPADGFYEWEKQGRARLPHYFALKTGEPFFFGGIWEPAREDLPASFAIVTTAPNALLSPIHDRMPVMLGPNSGPAWLGGQPLAPVQLARLCRPLPANLMTGWRVAPRMNRAGYEAADCVAPLAPVSEL